MVGKENKVILIDSRREIQEREVIWDLKFVGQEYWPQKSRAEGRGV